jgi:hypothetical protein
MPTAAIVPMMVAITDDISAIISVFISADMRKSFWNNCLYQSSVKPAHTDLLLDALNENTISIKIGVYKNKNIRPTYAEVNVFFI